MAYKVEYLIHCSKRDLERLATKDIEGIENKDFECG
jgi:hypothetical protein